MKDIFRICKIVISIFILVFTMQSAFGYDQTFPTVKLRHGKAYYFNDTFNNNTNNQTYLQKFKVEFTEGGNYNGKANPAFNWTSQIKSTDYYVAPRTSVKFVQSNPDSYFIKYKPTTRKSNNLSIVYTVNYWEKVNGTWIDKGAHTEYQPYTITWCGDGVRDNYTDQYNGQRVVEACDPNDSSESGWGNGGCNNSCEPVTNPPTPVCKDISVSPKSGIVPLNSNIACTGENADSYKIRITKGNQTVANFNSRTANYTFSNDGTFKVQCYVNDDITSNACMETVEVEPTPPEPSCDSLSVTPQSGLTGLTSSFNCNGTDVDTYKVLIKKGGNTIETFNSKSGNYTFTSEGNYVVQCLVNDTITSNSCQKPVTVTDPEPEDDYDLALIKTLVGSKTVFKKGDEVRFNISVTNQGDVEANTVQVVDYIPAGLSLKGTIWSESNGKAYLDFGRIPVGVTKTEQIVFIVDTNTAGTIRNFAEISTDDGDDCDSTPDDTNGNQAGESDSTGMIDDNIGNGCNPGGDEDDHDYAEITTEVSEPDQYDLALRKTLSSSTPGPFEIGDEVEFEIEVFNQGDLDSGEIEITDYIPLGLTLSDGDNWTKVGDNAVRTVTNIEAGESIVLKITFEINANAGNTITNIAEISQDSGEDCDSDPDNNSINDGIITDNAVGNGCNPGGDEDDHDPETIVIQDGEDKYDIALIKTLSSSTPGPFQEGDTVVFDITVENQGNIVATVKEIVDYIPTGLTLNDNNWSLESGNAYYNTDIVLNPGQSETIEITFTVNSDATDTVRNFAEISEDDGDDCDSTPDDENENQDGETENTGMENDQLGFRCDDDADEDDHDFEDIVIGTPNPSIKIDKTDANPDFDQDGNIGGNDSQKVNKGEVAIFKIRVTNDGTEDLKSIVISDIQAPNCAGDVTLPSTYPSSWANFTTGGSGNLANNILEPGEYFEYTCEKDNTQSDYTNTVKVNAVGTDSGDEVSDTDTSVVDVPGGGGSGSTYQCLDIIQSGSNVTCVGNRKVESFKLYCGTGEARTILYKNAIEDGSTGRMQAEFSCGEAVAECFAYDEKDTTSDFGPAWKAGNNNVCKTDLNPFCGNGKVDPGEQCDISAAPYGDWGDCGKPGTSRECKLPGGGGGDPSCEDDGTCVLTWPNDGELIFGPHGSKVVGHGVNPVEEFGEKPYLWNNSDYDFSFEQLCIKRDSDSSITGGDTLANSTYCKDLTSRNRMIYAYEKVEFDDYPNFTTDKDGIPSGAAYGEGTFSTTIYDDGLLYENAYFAGKLEVRVAKPAVVTTGGGTSYVKDSSVTGDLRKVTDGLGGDYVAEQDTNTNFAGVSASESADAVSSNALELDNSDSEAILDVQESQESLDEVQEVIDTAGAISGSFTNYNGFDNVFIVSGDYTLSSSDISDIASLSEPTTYIVENGDLTIPANIIANKNVAFVANGGDIIIDGSVTEIDGTYISIKTVSGGGSIRSNGGTNSQLVVNGPLYGDISDLVDNRYYVDDTAGKLSVGTIVSFGSSLLTKPAPLVSQFVAEYLASEKVAR